MKDALNRWIDRVKDDLIHIDNGITMVAVVVMSDHQIQSITTLLLGQSSSLKRTIAIDFLRKY